MRTDSNRNENITEFLAVYKGKKELHKLLQKIIHSTKIGIKYSAYDDSLYEHAIIHFYTETEIWPDNIESTTENKQKYFYYTMLMTIIKINMSIKRSDNYSDKLDFLNKVIEKYNMLL